MIPSGILRTWRHTANLGDSGGNQTMWSTPLGDCREQNQASLVDIFEAHRPAVVVETAILNDQAGHDAIAIIVV